MLIYGYCKGYQYTGDGTLMVKVRIPTIHGAMNQSEYRGQTIRNYVSDDNLPYYQSLLLPHLPNDGDVVALTNEDDAKNSWVVIGLTGAQYTVSQMITEGEQ